MPNLLAPRPWTSQPQYPVGINLSNSVTQGIIYSNVGSNLPTNAQGASLRPVVGINSLGATLDTRNAGGFRVPLGNLTNGYTICATICIVSTTPPTGVFLSISDGTVGGAFTMSGGQVLMYEGGVPYFYDFKNYNDILAAVFSGATSIKPMVPFNILVTVTAGNIAVSYSNGKQYYYSALGGGSPTSAIGTSSFLEYGDPDTSSSLSYMYNQVTVWNRPLSQPEAMSVSANPWQIFSPALC